jgi:hypothetical protein
MGRVQDLEAAADVPEQGPAAGLSPRQATFCGGLAAVCGRGSDGTGRSAEISGLSAFALHHNLECNLVDHVQSSHPPGRQPLGPSGEHESSRYARGRMDAKDVGRYLEARLVVHGSAVLSKVSDD